MDGGQRRGDLRHVGQPLQTARLGPLHAEAAAKTRLYLHVFDWPKDGKLNVPAKAETIQKAYLLAEPAKTALPVEKAEPRDDPSARASPGRERYGDCRGIEELSEYLAPREYTGGRIAEQQ